VFRFYGRILKHDFAHLKGQRLVDFGCGRGTAVNFFHDTGYDAVGVDISETDIAAGRKLYPAIAERLQLCDMDPSKVPSYGFAENVAIVTAVQSPYYLDDAHFDVCIRKLAAR
jgi:SAM-dependent methyltransferase